MEPENDGFHRGADSQVKHVKLQGCTLPETNSSPLKIGDS